MKKHYTKQGGLFDVDQWNWNTLHGTNLLCCISSDLLKTSVLVSGMIISEIPVSIEFLACNSAILTEGNPTKSQGLVLCL